MRTCLFLVCALVVTGCTRSSVPDAGLDFSTTPPSMPDGAVLDLRVTHPCGFEQTCVRFTTPGCGEYCGCPSIRGDQLDCQPPFECATNNGMCDLAVWPMDQ